MPEHRHPENRCSRSALRCALPSAGCSARKNIVAREVGIPDIVCNMAAHAGANTEADAVGATIEGAHGDAGPHHDGEFRALPVCAGGGFAPGCGQPGVPLADRH